LQLTVGIIILRSVPGFKQLDLGIALHVCSGFEILVFFILLYRLYFMCSLHA